MIANEILFFFFQDRYGCESDNSLYFIDRHNIKCIDLKSVNSTYVSVKTVRSDLIQGGAIDIHYRGRMIYWSDNSLWTLNRMSLTSGEKEVITLLLMLNVLKRIKIGKPNITHETYKIITWSLKKMVDTRT